MFNICIVGWYYNTAFIESILSIAELYEREATVHIVNKREDFFDYSDNSKRKLHRLQTTAKNVKLYSIENVGLEWGAYSFFVNEVFCLYPHPTIFIHDDVEIKNLKVFKKVNEEAIIKTIDQAYVFRDKGEEISNGRMHGRCWYGSERFLQALRYWHCDTCKHAKGFDCPHNKGYKHEAEGLHFGIWYDRKNRGHIGGKVPEGVKHYNDGIYHFHWQIGQIKSIYKEFNVHQKIYAADIVAGRRNNWTHVERERERMKQIEKEESKHTVSVS